MFTIFKENDTIKYNCIQINKCPYKLKLSEINFYIRPIYSSLIICQYELSIYINYEFQVSESTLANKVFFYFYEPSISYEISN